MKFILTETRLYEIRAEDKEDALAKFDDSEDGDFPLLDMEVTVDAV